MCLVVNSNLPIASCYLLHKLYYTYPLNGVNILWLIFSLSISEETQVIHKTCCLPTRTIDFKSSTKREIWRNDLPAQLIKSKTAEAPLAQTRSCI